MVTVLEQMNRQREVLQSGTSNKPGPPVIVESSGSAEVLLPENDTPPRVQPWVTQPFRLSEAEMEHHDQVRIERMMRLQDLVSDSSAIIELRSRDNKKGTPIFLGRAKRNDVVLEDETISSVHASVEDTGAAFLLFDRDSSNGTFVNTQRLKPGEPMPLVSGDCLRFGKRVYYYLTGERLLLFLELRIVKARATERSAEA